MLVDVVVSVTVVKNVERKLSTVRGIQRSVPFPILHHNFFALKCCFTCTPSSPSSPAEAELCPRH